MKDLTNVAFAVADPRSTWTSLTQGERDAAYDNNGAVADSPALIEKRNRGSAAYRKAHPAGLDIPYGPKERNRWDLYPAKNADAPCLVFIHGGYWQRNTREDFATFMAGVQAHGWSAALPGYSLAPEAKLGDIVGEIRAALDWLKAEGPKHGIAGPVILSGWSAGGHLTAMALDHPLVAAGFAISGVYDLEALRDTKLNQLLQLTDDEIATLSPLRLPMVNKPMTIAYGTAELPALVNDSRNLHAMRAAAHAPGVLLPVAHANHFNILEQLADPEGQLTLAALDLARACKIGESHTGRAA
ncbi:alpha/beta hydrolase [Pseudorhodoplanes sinuspersici]|uniref:Alpha/beta hydrolase n=1 Tax=Pseudorhodoplanes sinuspersici TaxID=1235591 RepID=A0A1W6ZZ55_9HYPH|nr:alpha/beta hydrolase [Pseudorhodoplanes sinuspersici]ARQ02677.1 alpha/beta hydrolase [Pseudorhodoplanes sinuspersici]